MSSYCLRSKSVQILGGIVAASLAVSMLGASSAQAAAGSKGGKSKAAVKREKQAKPSVTTMRFKLDNEDVTAGDTVMGSVKVLTGNGRYRVALEGAELSVKIDGVEAGSLVTNEDGTAVISLVAEEGEHVVKVFYAGDATHRKAQRAQGYEAVALVEEPTVTDPPLEEGDGTGDETVVEGGEVTPE